MVVAAAEYGYDGTTYAHDFTGQLTDADHASQDDEAYEYDENGNA
jgi:hypothetical protein